MIPHLTNIRSSNISRNEALDLLHLEDSLVLKLVAEAYELRKKKWGKKVHIQYLSNSKSGNCSEDCHYCSQSSVSNAQIDKHSLLTENEIVKDSNIARELNAKRFCTALSGKYVSDKEIDKLCNSFRKIKADGTLDICCSLGFITKEQAEKLKKSGLDRVNHNLNSSKNYYSEICTTHTYDERIQNIKRCKGAGLEICSGGIIGQGESDQDIIDLLFELKEIDPHSIPINFLIPVAGTPFGKNQTNLTPVKCLKILALARIILPEKEIRMAGGREVHLKSLQPMALYCVNSIFVRGYLTEDGQKEDQALSMIEDLGFELEIESAGK